MWVGFIHSFFQNIFRSQPFPSTSTESPSCLFKNNVFVYLFIYFWLRWVFVAVRRLSLVAVSGGCSPLWCPGFSLRWLLLLWSTGSRCAGSVVVAHRLSCSMGLWDLPGPGLQPFSPALAGGFLTTASPGKSPTFSYLDCCDSHLLVPLQSWIRSGPSSAQKPSMTPHFLFNNAEWSLFRHSQPPLPCPNCSFSHSSYHF